MKDLTVCSNLSTFPLKLNYYRLSSRALLSMVLIKLDFFIIKMFHSLINARHFIHCRKVFTYSWNNIFEWGSGDHAYIQANAGYKVYTSEF